MAQTRIVDRGFQHYRGARLGPTHATWAMVRAGMRRVLGIRRPTAHKLVPVLMAVVTYGEAAIVLLLSRTPGALPMPYPVLYGNMAILFAFFAAFAAPDLLCADRRERVLSLYFAAPITRLQYVTAQTAALTLLLLLFTLVPYLLLFAAHAFLSDDAVLYLRDNAGDLWHLILGGGMLALYYGALALAVAAFTDRRAYAAGAYLGLLLVSSAAGAILVNGLRFAGHERFALIDLTNLPVRALAWVFGTAGSQSGARGGAPDLGAAYLVATLAVIAASLALLVWRYLSLRD